MRKPLIICDTANPANPLIYWGPRQILRSRATIQDQLSYDRFKVNDKSPVKKVTGKLAERRGINLVTSVIENLQVPNIILDSEVLIAKHGKLKNASDIGDIDVLVIDVSSKILYSLECKNFAPSRNIKEMIEECDKLLGSKSEKGLIRKHEIRHNWLLGNLDKVSSLYHVDVTNFEVKSVFITGESMLFPYLQNMGVAMPFITLYDLKKNGMQSLSDL